MPKHRSKKSLADKDGELKGTKAEIDGKVQEIIKLLNEEDDNDRKTPLADLIKDFHNHYASLSARYDNLTEELRKKAQGKDSSSSSSDSSDSDDSHKKKGKKNGKLKNGFDVNKAEVEKWNEEKSRLYSENADLKVELDIARKLQAELNQKLEGMDTERESLLVEKTNAEELRTVNGQLQHERDNLQLQLEAATGELLTLKEKIESGENKVIKLSQMQKATEEENTTLSSKISQLENAIKHSENKIHELETESSQLTEKVVEKERELSSHLEMHLAHKEESSIRVKDLEMKLDSSHTQRREVEKRVEEIPELLIQIKRLEEKLTNKSFELNKKIEEMEIVQLKLNSTNDLKVELEEQVNRLEKELGSLSAQKSEQDVVLEKKNEEIAELLIQIEKLKSEVNQLREEKSVLELKISEFGTKIVEKGDEIFAIQKKLEDVENEKSAEIADLTENINSLQQEVELLNSDNSKLEMQIERIKQEFVGGFSLVESQKTELLNQIVVLERKLKERDDALMKLQEEKDEEINQLEETIEDLRRDLEMKTDEMSTLVENMRNSEVKQRLTIQKLHITEQLLGEREDNHQSRVDKLKEEQKSLEGRIIILSGIIGTYREAQTKLAKEISEKVNHSITGIDLFGMKFEEDCGHLESRIYETVNELKVTKNWISESNVEKDQLKKRIASLVQQLNKEKEQELLLMGQIWELEARLRKDDDERKQREEKMGELEKMIEEMERTINEKDGEISSLSEEKREAIRQLCIWIDYHHNRYDDLKASILKRKGGARRQKAT